MRNNYFQITIVDAFRIQGNRKETCILDKSRQMNGQMPYSLQYYK